MADNSRLTENLYKFADEFRPTEARDTFRDDITADLGFDPEKVEIDQQEFELFEEAILEAKIRVEVPIITLR